MRKIIMTTNLQRTLLMRQFPSIQTVKICFFFRNHFSIQPYPRYKNMIPLFCIPAFSPTTHLLLMSSSLVRNSFIFLKIKILLDTDDLNINTIHATERSNCY